MRSEMSNFHFRGEFEPQTAVWLGWPVSEVKKGLSAVPLYLRLTETLSTHVHVNLAVQNQQEEVQVQALLQQTNTDMSRVSFYQIPHNDIWFRDVGPIFLSDDQQQMLVNGFGFNCWGYEAKDSPSIILDQHVAEAVATRCQQEYRYTSLISEGGNREFNGLGVMMATASVERQRNPDLSLDEITDKLIATFNLEKIIWLDKGLYEDDSAFETVLPGADGLKNVMPCLTTGGHIDEYCRFVSEDTVMLAHVSEEEAKNNPIAQENRERLERNLVILQQSTDQNGRPFHIIRMPAPEHVYLTLHPGDGMYDYYLKKYGNGFIQPVGNEIKAIAASSYCNFLITNNMVLAPCYWKPGFSDRIREKDEQAKQVFQQTFPDREIHMFDVTALNIGGGGIHCITQQQPFSFNTTTD